MRIALRKVPQATSAIATDANHECTELIEYPPRMPWGVLGKVTGPVSKLTI